ncbi:MAG: PAC2 family protein [Chloroflexi bacterium]|nr:PAC2 family protein [Chloroflexota bacterium]
MESYINSILQLLKRLGVRRYCLLGAMYDVVPHTRPLIITGSAQGAATEETVRRMGIEASSYEGPTTITVLISQTAPEMGIETMSAIVHLPQYAQVDEDYTGALRLLQILSSMYGLPISLSQLENDAERQRAEITEAAERNPQLRHMIRQIETHYEARVKKDVDSSPGLSPEVEKFLRELGKRMEGE